MNTPSTALRKCHLLAASLLTMTFALGAELTQLEIGDPTRRDRNVPVLQDAITDTGNNELLSVAELAEQLADTGILFFGENHTDMDFHRAQYQLIRALHDAGREVLVGLEMFPYTRQPELDRWTRGELGEAEFLNAADWFGSWGYRWEYYADIFRYARDKRLRMVGVNAPRHVVTAVRTQGFDGLTEEERRHVPIRVDTSSDEHRQLFKASFEDDDALHANISEEQWEGMLRAQATWDAVMGWNAAQALKEAGPEAIIVVLIGAGHVTYGLGSERQIRDLYEGNIASVVPVQVVSPEGEAIKEVRASYANYVWGLPAALPPQYPSLGVSVAGRIGKHPNKIIQVSKDSIAAEYDFEVGDLLISIGSSKVESLATLRKAMANYNWGDRAEVTIGRDNQTITKTVFFRRKPD